MKEYEKRDPTIIDEINNEFKKTSTYTVEGIAESLGIGKEKMNEWLRDGEFTGDLERFRELQKTIPLDEEFGSRLDAMMIAFILLEAKNKG